MKRTVCFKKLVCKRDSCETGRFLRLRYLFLSEMKNTPLLLHRLFLLTACLLLLCTGAMGKPFAGSDSVPKPAPAKDLFLRIGTGIGFVNSNYTSEVVTGGAGGFNNVDDYHGNGFQVPVEISAGFRHHNFSAGLGLSIIYFHVPTLTRSVNAIDSTNATGAPVKNQIGSMGKNYLVPLFLEYRFIQKIKFGCSARVAYGVFLHDRNAYDGVYAPSSSPLAFGHSFSFAIVPSYTHVLWSVFLSPGLLLTQIRYHGSSNEELTDLSFNLGIGIDYILR
jgi:hypothetical protein